MKYCMECGASNEDLASSCTECGTPLPQLEKVSSYAASVVYCPNCGSANDSDLYECVQCNEVLPKLTPAYTPIAATAPATFHSSGLVPRYSPVETSTFWQKLGPALRAAILTSFVVSGIQSLSSLFPGLGFAFSAPFAVIAYYAQGIVTGKLAKSDPRYQHSNVGHYARLGVISAVWTSLVISTILTIIVLSFEFALTIGSIAVLIPVILVSRLADIFLNVCFSALGAWMYGRSGGKGILGISIGVLGCGISLACLLSVIVLTILGVIGTNIFQGISGWFGQ